MAVSQKRNATDEESKKNEARYYDVLYDFFVVIQKLNEMAVDGREPRLIEKSLCKLIPVFSILCGIGEDGNIDISKMKLSKKVGRTKKKV